MTGDNPHRRVEDDLMSSLFKTYRGVSVLVFTFGAGLLVAITLVGWWAIPAQVEANTLAIKSLDTRVTTIARETDGIERKIDWQICSQRPRPDTYTLFLLDIDCSNVPPTEEP